MKNRRARRPAATAAVLLAAALVLTGCGSGDGDGDAKSDAARAAAEQAARGGASAKPDPADSPAPAPSATVSQGAALAPAKPSGDTLPDEALKPVTGSFTGQEKKYLSGRVPAKTDPAAVLQTGQESCQRVARTAKRDKDAAVASVISGEIKGAADAITLLCPDQKPVLDAARTGIADGATKTPKAGTYRAVNPNPSCTWQALDSSGGVLASGPGPGTTPGTKITAKIPAGAASFTSTGCNAWLPA
ncbi:hypothetical protein ACN20G_06115 [Streptomyces sp. BI20]|uniref:hypothetical protein n=1 Tax=Streptomyces sp. BI20 TaxID=3403460 RepID=UPI003C75FF44